MTMQEVATYIDDVESLITPVPVVKMIPALQTRARRSARRGVG